MDLQSDWSDWTITIGSCTGPNYSVSYAAVWSPDFLNKAAVGLPVGAYVEAVAMRLSVGQPSLQNAGGP